MTTVPKALLHFLAYFFLATISAASVSVSKRNVLYQFKPMVESLTGCSALDYVNHGCWCGLGHKGESLVDGIDGCCKIHDTCYEVMQQLYKGCNPYEANYGWRSGGANGVAGTNCTDGRDGCKHGICLCDLAAARCFRQFACPKSQGTECPPDHAGAPAAPPKRAPQVPAFWDQQDQDQTLFSDGDEGGMIKRHLYDTIMSYDLNDDGDGDDVMFEPGAL